MSVLMPYLSELTNEVQSRVAYGYVLEEPIDGGPYIATVKSPGNFTRSRGTIICINFFYAPTGNSYLDVNNTGPALMIYKARGIIDGEIVVNKDALFTWDGNVWRLLNPIIHSAPKRLIAEFQYSGTFNISSYTKNSGETLAIGDKIDVFLVGGGGGGGAQEGVSGTLANYAGGGGGGGYCIFLKDFKLTASSYLITVGAGGTGAAAASGNTGGTGGITSAFGQYALGGGGSNWMGVGGQGGSAGGYGATPNRANTPGGSMGGAVGVTAGGGNISYQPFNPYDGIFYGCGGGGGWTGGGVGDFTCGHGGGAGGIAGESGTTLPTASRGGGGGGAYSGSASGGGNGGIGGGGGGGGAGTGQGQGTGGKGGNGGSGLVLIYA